MKTNLDKQDCVSHDELLRTFEYDHDTGNLVWKIHKSSNATPGAIAGNRHDGYTRIILNRKRYLAHRLIWFFVHGVWPEQIDHINGVKTDNRLENLRNVSHIENMRNQRKPRHNSSGIVGVRWYKKSMKWRACIYVSNKEKFLGDFENLSDAISTRKAAEVEYGFHQNHGR